MAQRLQTRIVIDGENRTGRAVTQARAGIQSISQQLSRLKTELLALAGIGFSIGAVKDLVAVADAYKDINARIAQATKGTGDYAQAQQSLFDIAQRTNTAYEATAGLFARTNRSLNELGYTQHETLGLTEAINLALGMSGVSAESASNAVTQLAQGLGSGVLRGDEFNSVMENGGRLAQALADGLGVPIGKLREMAEAGELTTAKVLQALLSQLGTLRSEYEQFPVTVSKAMTKLNNAWQAYVGNMDSATGATGALSSGISALADHIDEVAEAALGLGAVAASVFAGRFVGAVTSAVAATIKQVQAEAQATAATLASLRAKAAHTEALRAHAAMLLADAEAAVANASGMARLAVVQNTLVPAQQRLTAATAASTAAQASLASATRSASVSLTAARGALAFLGGPLGIVITLLGTAATAWAVFGSRAQSAARATNDFTDKLRAAKAQLADTSGAALDEEIGKVEKGIRELETLLSGLRPGEDVLVKTFRERKQAAEEYLEILKKRRKELATPGATPVPEDTEDGAKGLAEKRLSLLRSRLEAQGKVVKESLDRQQRDLDAQLAQHLISYRDYYSRKRALAEQALDADIRRTQAELDAQRAALAGTKEEKDRLGMLGDIAKLESELTVLRSQRAEAGVQAAREQAAAERELADTLSSLRATLAASRGDTVTARVTELVQQYRGTLRQLQAEGNQAGIEIVSAIFETEVAKARLDEIESDWDAALERMRDSEERINSARENGLITEVTARREIIHLHRQTYGELQRMLPLLEAQARIIGGDTPAAIARLRTELEDIGRVTDEVAARINDSVRTSLTEFLDSIGEGSANARDMLLDLVRTARRIASERIADAIAVKLNIGGKVSGALGERGNSPAAPVYVQDVTKALVPGSEIPGAPETEGLFSQVTDWVSNLGAQIGSALSGLGSALGGLLNSLASAVAGLFGGGGSGLSSLTSLVASLFHTGGIGASPLMHRRVSAELFAAAPRFHSGNAAQLLGLGPRELPAIIRDDEEVLTRSDPRHVLNGGLSQAGGASAAQSLRMVLVDDRANIADYMSSSDGERVIVQAIRRNSMTVRQILGG